MRLKLLSANANASLFRLTHRSSEAREPNNDLVTADDRSASHVRDKRGACPDVDRSGDEQNEENGQDGVPCEHALGPGYCCLLLVVNAEAVEGDSDVDERYALANLRDGSIGFGGELVKDSYVSATW
jgi:hypothetical protein